MNINNSKRFHDQPSVSSYLYFINEGVGRAIGATTPPMLAEFWPKSLILAMIFGPYPPNFGELTKALNTKMSEIVCLNCELSSSNDS